MNTVLWLCPSLSTETLKWLSSLPTLMQESFWWWQCSDRYIISFSPQLHNPFPPSLISRTVSVDVKHHVYLLTWPSNTVGTLLRWWHWLTVIFEHCPGSSSILNCNTLEADSWKTCLSRGGGGEVKQQNTTCSDPYSRGGKKTTEHYM